MLWDRRLRDWLDWGRRSRRWADTTCTDYHRRARGWLDWCAAEGLRPTRATARDVHRWLATLHPTPAVRSHAHTAILAWFDWQVHLGKVARNPVRDVPRVPVHRTLPRSLEPGTVTAVLAVAAAHGPEVGCFVGILAYAGLRRAEACHVRWVDVEGHDAWIRVTHGKGGQERMVPVHERLRPLIVRWRSAREDPTWLFPGRYPDEPISTATATNWTRSVLDDAGLPDVTGHWLRHSMGRRMVEVGVPLPDVSAALGHRTLSSTTIYTRARPANVAAAVAMLDY